MQAQPPEYRREVRSTPAWTTLICAGVAPKHWIACDHTIILPFASTPAGGRNVPLSDFLSTDGTFPQRCRLAHTDRNRGTRAAVLFDIRTIDLAHGALAEAAGGNAAITLLADDRGDLTGGLRFCRRPCRRQESGRS